MKANEAPERIYLQPNIGGKELIRPWLKVCFDQDSIEYIRTDAFIEKACEWLSDTLQTIVDVESPSKHHVESIPALGSINQTEFVDKFRKEIKYLFD